MLEAPDPDAEAESLRARGLGVLPLMAGAGGRDVHPRSTHGVLIRVYPSRSFVASPDQIERRVDRALGLSGIARVVIAVRDAKRALDTYGRGLGLAAQDPTPDPRRGVTVARCGAPEGAVVELAEPVATERPYAAALAQRFEEAGEGMFALVLQAPDPAAAAVALAERGLRVSPLAGEEGVFEVDPASLFGTRVHIERDS
jgi:catechol 2,3-dioxygenase-like lactoylglutathione lyase family enzyme